MENIWSLNWEKVPGRVRLQRLQFQVPAFNPRIFTNWYHHQSVTNCSSGFMLMLFVLLCKTWNTDKPGAWLARSSLPPPPPPQSQDFCPHLIYGAASLALKAGSHSQSLPVGQCPGRLEARSEACSALSLKPKQDYSLNVPNTQLELASPLPPSASSWGSEVT